MAIDVVGAYDQAYSQLIDSALGGFLMSDQVLSSVPILPTEHAGPIRNVSGLMPLDLPMQPLSFGALWSEDIVRNTDIDRHTDFIGNLAASQLEVLLPGLFNVHARVTDAVGNSIDAGGRLSHDLIFEILKKIPLSFDEDGKYSIQIIERGEELYIQNGNRGVPIQPYNSGSGADFEIPGSYYISLLPPKNDSLFILLMTEYPPTEDQIKRHNAIIAQKRAEFHAQQRSRRL